jgi:exosortase/archaeosortase family protein
MDYKEKLIIRVVIAFLLFIIPYSLINFILLKFTLYGSYPLLFLKYNPIINGNAFIIENTLLKIISACVATSAYYLLFGLVIFTKDIKLKQSIYLILFGSIAIFLANILRIDLLIYIFVEFGKNFFERVHLFLWQFVSSIYVALIWIFLVKKLKIKTIPVYSDIKHLMHLIKPKKRKSKKRK